MKKNIVILGTQWGDEGKGKIVDYLSKKSSYVVRYHGGHNAGHTLVVNTKKIILHLIPSGLLHTNVIGIISNGVVISISELIKEIEMLKKNSFIINKRLFISQSAALILPFHIAMDVAREKKLGINAIGTTGRGIGPAYEDKIARRSLRIGDLKNEKQLSIKLKKIVNYYNDQLVYIYKHEPFNYKVILKDLLKAKNIIDDMIADTTIMLHNAIKNQKTIIFEGAQGSLLDIDHGTYPYVTSSNSTIGGVITGTGVGPKNLNYILGVTKSYSTRVGNGPFPTEVFNSIDDYLTKKGNEFGSTTGRKRRTGWLDGVALRYSVKLNSLSALCITKLDVLDGLKEIKICTAYQDINTLKIYSSLSFFNLTNIKPIYETYPGWMENTSGVQNIEDLPNAARHYIKCIEKIAKVPVHIISTGPDRNDTILIKNIFL
ncbi:adenylosuccinate synthase [Buchnera aphidicola (Aphis helianthi)]|uniref:Adenylosuccinate synthetase n=1 Tax=Buchnera aphidicola (Aphis helianthi) TaxID=2315802 RepID=A0A4D6XSB8_9GAMM|nr:adenylosuccinate synthase [Buchnera aphidicola]QCI17360.1 adenylosuccinate synthase [Buchnera aphidicola (Aphis helianthi)]